jgi:hypothetical protein
LAAGCEEREPALSQAEAAVYGIADPYGASIRLTYDSAFVGSGVLIHLEGGRGVVMTLAGNLLPAERPGGLGGPGANRIELACSFGSRSYAIDEIEVWGSFSLGLATFSYGDGDMPTPIPPLSPTVDAVENGTRVTHTGFGVYKGHFPSCSFALELGSVGVSVKGIETRAAEEGVCWGDYGGPAIVVSDGADRVAGILESIGYQCRGVATSLRVSAWMADRIIPWFREHFPVPSCEACLADGECAVARAACAALPECVSLDECTAGCSDIGCADQCFAAAAPSALPPFERLRQCRCGGDCWMSCGDAASCVSSVFAFSPDSACGGCLLSQCFAETVACRADYDCRSGLLMHSFFWSDRGAAVNDFGWCVRRNCEDFCEYRSLPELPTPPPEPVEVVEPEPTPDSVEPEGLDASPHSDDSGCSLSAQGTSSWSLVLFALLLLHRRRSPPNRANECRRS